MMLDHYKARCENDPNYAKREISNPAKYFIKFMNETAKDLGLLHTYYANPHGLVNPNNYSTAVDQAKLTFLLLKQNYVKEIVNTRVHNCKIEQANGFIRAVTWENTNRLLCREGWNGVKTGITTAAGPCLSAYYKNRDGDFIIILLCSISMEIRWIEAPKLVDYAIKNRDDLKPAN
jgi:D-alanyl-D-alanine carboxypeptidase